MTGYPASLSITLALQGGGAHGAFTWGVLDALLEDETLFFEGISGTSAGAMNAVALAHGLMTGGRQGARETLRRFWTMIADLAPLPGLAENPGASAPAMKMMLQWSSYLTPEQINPFDLNPLRDIIGDLFDFSRLRRESPLKLFIATTHANSGKVRIFGNAELSSDVLLASACLPTIHRTVHIAGEPYWDGGYSANPAVFPLFYDCKSSDILLVLLTPLHYAETPETAEDIRTRLRELAFNSTFLREMRMFAHLHDQIDSPGIPEWLLDRLPIARFERRLAGLRFHAICAEHILGEMPSESKLTVNHEFFESLFAAGRAHARRWLAQHRHAIGKTPTLDLGKLFY